jgi:hypothetical protein
MKRRKRKGKRRIIKIEKEKDNKLKEGKIKLEIGKKRKEDINLSVEKKDINKNV